jgi:hypothetical protein
MVWHSFFDSKHGTTGLEIQFLMKITRASKIIYEEHSAAN